MRSASSIHFLLAVSLSISSVASAAVVEIKTTTLLNADVVAVLGDPASPSDSKESHDGGDVLKPDVTASATASVPVETSTFTGAGKSEAHLTSSDDGFVLTGRSSTALAGISTLAGEVRSSASIDMFFDIADGFHAAPKFTAAVDRMVDHDEKVTLVINRGGEQDALFAKTFDDSFGGTLAELDAGSYRLQLITGSISTTKGIPSEAGAAAFELTLNATPVESTVIPLPTALVSGAPTLALATLVAKRWRAHGL